MPVTLTAKLKLTTTPAQAEQLRRTAVAYRDALNYTSRLAYEGGKLSNAVRVQKLVYRELRERFGLSAQLACNVPRQVAATYKGLWTKVRQNAAHRARGFTKKRYRGLDQPPNFVSLTATFSYGHDYRFKAEQQVSITTLDGRLVLPYQGYTPHLESVKAGRQFGGAQGAHQRPLSPATEEQERAEHERRLNETTQALPRALEEPEPAPEVAQPSIVLHAEEEPTGVTFGAAKLWRDPRTKQWYLLVTLVLPKPEVRATTSGAVKGIDLGMRYLAVSTTPDNQTQFLAGGATVHQGEAFQRVRQRLQHKGTRSATARLRAFALRERRFKASVNHHAANLLVEPATLLGLEDLTHMRERTQRKGKRNRRKYAKWAFAEVGAFIAYKAALVGSVVVKVDADYTSQQCPRCGYRAKGNRPGNGLRFHCTNPAGCHFELHADLVGARQVCLRSLAVRQDWAATGRLSPAPDVSSVEAKAARLQRYAELRWRTDASPPPLGVG
jgi:putative transposase